MEDYLKEKEFVEKLIDSYLKLILNEQEKLGIPDNGYIYHNISEHQNRGDELSLIIKELC